MNPHLIKSICHQIADEMGGHKVAANLASVCPSVWSDYCSFDKPDTTIPMHRAAAIEMKTGKRWFSRAMAEQLDEQQAESEDPCILGALALEAIAKAEVSMARAFADGTITESEKRSLLADAQRLIERAHDFGAAISTMQTGNVQPIRTMGRG